MLLNWCGGFGTQELIFVMNMTGEHMQLVLSKDTIDNWIELNKANPTIKDDNIIISIIAGELLHQEGLVSGTDEKLTLDFGTNILRMRHASDNLYLGVFKVTVSELWPLVFLGESWHSLLLNGMYKLPAPIGDIVNTGITNLRPTLITQSIMDNLENL